VAALARERVEALEVLEAADGVEAVQVGLRQRPHIALLDVAMPRLGGIEAAITLRELQPRMRIALATGEWLAHRDRAREQRLPLFDKLDLDRALDWLEVQADACARRPPSAPFPASEQLGLQCSCCGYGVARAVPPERCPMCHRVGPWARAPRRQLSSAAPGERVDRLRRQRVLPEEAAGGAARDA
jgi:CheY-like chemotaxis protein